MNWSFVILCVVCATLFPELPIHAGRGWGYQSLMPLVASCAMILGSLVYLLVYLFTKVLTGGRWLASAFAVVSLIGIGSGLLAIAGLTGFFSPDYYNVFRGVPSHVLQGVALVIILLHIMENAKNTRANG